MKLRICAGDLHLTNLTTRMPFKYGIATMTRMPMAFVRLRVEVDGRQSLGLAADLLPPKWFTKDPARAVEEEIQEMRGVIEHALVIAPGITADSPFDAWRELYETQAHWAADEQLPPLLAHFGTSLVERALLEAFCRAQGRPFHRLLLGDHLGIRLGDIHPSLGPLTPADLLPPSPLREIQARHTVGLSDPLTDEEIAPAERLDDGLPQSLAAGIRAYGLRHFKVKVSGELERDVERVRRVFAVVRAGCGADCVFTLDGNEQFPSIAAFRELWETLRRDDSLSGFLAQVLFVEQPLPRAAALRAEVGKEFAAWPERPRFIIDESDATLESFPAALALNYDGTSHKNCKGVFKSIVNRCLLEQRRRAEPGRRFLMSGEDLCNLGPVALLQDLAVCAALGIESVERNGHHYNAGLSQFPQTVQEQMMKSHGDLYQRSAAGWPTLKITGGKVALATVNESPFGVRFLLDAGQFTPAAQWRPA